MPMAAALRLQLAPRDVVRFMRRETAGTTRRDSSLAWSSETP